MRGAVGRTMPVSPAPRKKLLASRTARHFDKEEAAKRRLSCNRFPCSINQGVLMSKFIRLFALCLAFAGALANAQTVVRVGSTPTGIPFTFLDTKTNQISGVMVDLI